MTLGLLTIGTVNHAAGIRVTLDTFKEHHPKAQLFTCLVDGQDGYGHDLALPGVVFSVDELQLPGGRRFAFKFTPFELCCALKAFAASHVLERYGIERLVYLDSDVMVFASMEDSLDAGWTTAKILCTPHFIGWPSEPAEILRQVRQYGTYNAGFLGVVDSLEARRFLTWWGAMCSEMGISEPATGRFVDQVWLDLVVAERYGFSAVLDLGMNVGYWNLSERALEKDGPTWRVNQQRLKFFHFSGFDANRLTERRTFVPQDIHVAIAREYGERLREAGLDRLQALPYGLAAYQDGTAIPLAHRRAIFRDEPSLANLTDPFRATDDPGIWQVMSKIGLESMTATPRYLRLAKRLLNLAVRGGRGVVRRWTDSKR